MTRTTRTRNGHEGFSLVEMLVAICILASGLVTLAQLSLMAATTTGRARRLTMSVALAGQKLEQLRGLAWSYDTLGLPVTDESSDVSVTPASPVGGRGLLPSPPGSLASNLPGYVDYLDQHGRWVGNGPAIVPGAVYVRRWAIETDPGDPANVVSLKVVVMVSERREGAADEASLPSREVLVASAKTRKYG